MTARAAAVSGEVPGRQGATGATVPQACRPATGASKGRVADQHSERDRHAWREIDMEIDPPLLVISNILISQLPSLLFYKLKS